MSVQILTHIELKSDNPLDAVIAGKHSKAYLVANLAFNDGAEASAAHYALSLAEVYGAMAFYHDNKESIDKALAEARQTAHTMGARDSRDAIAEIKARMQKKDE